MIHQRQYQRHDINDATIDVVIDNGGGEQKPRAGMDKAPYSLPIGRRRPREIEDSLFYEGGYVISSTSSIDRWGRHPREGCTAHRASFRPQTRL